jgi:UDP-2,4-diacetamido-2,4,6-trideoxy-beta-L-altropyranose hydrolase
MSRQSILFRADSSSTIGTGHIMRDLVLAKQYPNSKIVFATQELKGNLNSKILEAGYTVENLNSNNVEELVELVNRLSVNMVVIDHYGIDDKFEKLLKEQTSVQLMVLDDTYEKHHCDILLNHNISADKERYKGLVPSWCELRCGSDYTLIRDEFYKAKNSQTVFLAMGGADHSNINISILEVIKEFDNIEVIVVTTTANPNLKVLEKYVVDKDWIELHINTNIMAKLIKQSDFAIVTPSVTVNEVIFMDLPFIAIITADNQIDIYEYLRKNRYLTVYKFNTQILKRRIEKIMDTLI